MKKVSLLATATIGALAGLCFAVLSFFQRNPGMSTPGRSHGEMAGEAIWGIFILPPMLTILGIVLGIVVAIVLNYRRARTESENP